MILKILTFIFLLSRPWLKAEENLIDIPGISTVFENQIEKEISSFLDLSEQETYKKDFTIKL